MSRAESLYRLQLLDLELDQARRRLREIESLLAGSPALDHTRREAAQADKALRRASSELKSLELESQSLDEKIATEEHRLYAGQIRNPREMLDLQRELDSLRQQRGALDDQMLSLMEQVEQLRADHLRCCQALAQAERNFAEDSAYLRAERQKIEAVMEGQLEQREALCRSVPAGDVALYSAIRAKKPNGMAVALVKAGACSQCGEVAPSQLVQQAHTGAGLAICPNCGRILYAQ